MPNKIALDLQRLEDLAASGLSQKKTAETLGIKPGTLFGKISTDGEVKAAWERGLARREAAPADELPDEEKVFEAIRAGHRTCADIKRHTGLKNGSFMNAVEQLEVTCRIKSRDEHMLTHYYLRTEEFPTIEKPADAPPPPVSTALVSSSRHAETLERAAPDMKNVTPSREAEGRRQPELEVFGRAVVPLSERVDVDDALRGLHVERQYFEYHGTPSPTMSAVLSKVESTLQEIAREGVSA